VIAVKTGEDGGDGGWAIMSGSYDAGIVSLSIDEDQINDIERMHTTEQVAYIVFGETNISADVITFDSEID